MKNNNFVGKVFVVPLKNGGFSIGLVARQDKNILLGYFFNTYFFEKPITVKDLIINKSNICLICLFSILGLKNNEWTVIGSLPDWNKDEWAVPMFKQKDPLLDIYYAINYDDSLNEISKIKMSKEDANKLYNGGIYGYGIVESILTKIIKNVSC
jgi:hypothetical protein